MSKPSPLRIGVAGLGTVGQAVVSMLADQAPLISARAGRSIIVTAVTARDKNKKRDCNLSNIVWCESAQALATDNNIDVVVELIGGSEGVARELVEAALAAKKSVVTANKALIAHHGAALAGVAEKNHTALMFEAAVAGGIPVIKTLREGLAANQISKVMGILNGTCNYILTHMRDEKRSFDDVLAEAQKLGYAEAEPSFDVDGIDTAHKLAILTSLAFGTAPSIASVHIDGIRCITLSDMAYAHELGYVIKLLGIACHTPHGISQRVEPCMVERDSPLASVQGVFNAVQIQGDAVGSVFLEGRGAGGMPTASAVIADIIDIARRNQSTPFGVPSTGLVAAPDTAASEASSYYIRLGVIDKPGVLAEITSVFRDYNISLRSFIQHGHAPGETVDIVVATHATGEAQMQKALAALAAQNNVKEPPHSIRIETS